MVGCFSPCTTLHICPFNTFARLARCFAVLSLICCRPHLIVLRDTYCLGLANLWDIPQSLTEKTSDSISVSYRPIHMSITVLAEPTVAINTLLSGPPHVLILMAELISWNYRPPRVSLLYFILAHLMYVCIQLFWPTRKLLQSTADYLNSITGRFDSIASADLMSDFSAGVHWPECDRHM